MTSGSTSTSSAASSGRPSLDSSASSATACADVRGKPSRMKPFSVSGSCRRSVTRPMMTSSGTRSPASMKDFAFCPSGVPAFTAARSMSPVEMCGVPNSSTSLAACVPLPAPGAPNNTIFMMVQSFRHTIDAPYCIKALRRTRAFQQKDRQSERMRPEGRIINSQVVRKDSEKPRGALFRWPQGQWIRFVQILYKSAVLAHKKSPDQLSDQGLYIYRFPI